MSSITVANGSESAGHRRLADTLGVRTYFCDPHSAWLRGTNESFDGRLRRYYRKGNDCTAVTDEELENIVHKINKQVQEIPRLGDTRRNLLETILESTKILNIALRTRIRQP